MNQTKKHTTGKKLLALLLALIMSVSLLPMSVFAADLGTEAPIVEGQTQQDAALDESSGEEEIVDSQEPVVEDPAPVEEDTTEDVDTLAMGDEAAVQAAEISYVTKIGAGKKLDDSTFYRIVHIDCGRKYFKADDLKKIIDYAAASNYTHVELAFGNDGLRFLLDDMEVTASGVTYASEAVKSAIQAGNKAFYDAGTNELTQTQMNDIISYANGKGIGIIPMFDAPGHLQAVIRAMQTLNISMVEKTDYCLATKSGTSYNWALIPTNVEGNNFVQELVQKYINYFKTQGCTMFNIAADECGFSYNSDTGWNGMSNEQYTAYARLVNSMAARVQNAGMTALAFNDGIYHKNLTTSVEFDTNIAVCYWDASSDKYAPAATLAGKDFKIINTNNKWYYVLGSEGTGWFGYEWAQGYMNGSNKDCRLVDGGYYTDAGCMLALWCDNPSANVNWTNVENHIKTLSKNNSTYFTKVEVPEEVELPASDTETKVSVVVKGQEGQSTAVKVEAKAPRTEGLPASAEKVVSYEITPSVDNADYTGAGKVTLPVPAEWKDNADRVRGYIVTDGNVKTIQGSYNAATGKYTFDVPHFSEMGLILLAADSTEVTENRTITVTVGGTATDVIKNANYEGTYTTEDPSKATVKSAKYEKVDGEKKFTAATSVSSGNSYHIKNDAGEYLNASGKWVDDTANAAKWTVTYTYYNYNSGYYYLKCGSAYLSYLNNAYTTTTSSDSAYFFTVSGSVLSDYYRSVTLGTAGTLTTTEAKDGTTITFEGVAEGTTTVIIGHVKYTINVTKENLDGVSPLPIQTWITNNPIEVDNATTSADWGTASWLTYKNAYYVNVSAQAAYGEKGVAISDVLPTLIDRFEYGNTYWKVAKDDKSVTKLALWTGRVHDSATLQKIYATDYSNSGDEFQFVRYYGKTWAVSIDQKNWIPVTGQGSTGSASSCTQQIVAYYMIRSTITNEITTDVADWGAQYPASKYNSQVEDTTQTFVLLDFAVKYQDNSQNPDKFPVNEKTFAFHCTANDAGGAVHQTGSYYYRDLNNFRAVNTSDYEVYMVTVTMTSDNPGTTLTSSQAETANGYTYDGEEQVLWAIDQETRDKFTLKDYTSISGSSTYSGCKIGGDPYIRGVEVYRQHGALITYYVRAKTTVTDALTVHYLDRSADDFEFYSYPILVKQNTFFNENFAQVGNNTTNLTGNTVENHLGVTQTVTAELKDMPAIGAQYRYSDYVCVEVKRSDDGKDVYLYYTFNAIKTFVVDFGLPLTITTADINSNLNAVNAAGRLTRIVTKSSNYADVKTTNDYSIIYTLNKTIDGKDNVTATYFGTNAEGTENNVTYTLSIIPASTVYYEDSFAKFYGSDGAEQKEFAQTTDSDTMGTWYVDGAKENSTPDQALEELGKKNNVYGYDPAYNTNSTTFSMGSAKKVTVDATKFVYDPTVKFTFKGTGFDVISLTDNNSGAIVVNVERKDTNTTGYEAYNKNFLVNNYYGYSYDKTTHEWTVDNSAENNALYQIPVMKVTGLPYGEYAVTITVGYGEFFDKTNDGKYSFWMDAIRVYDPMGKDYDYKNGDDTDNESYPQYIKLRNALAKDDGSVTTNLQLLFIDGAQNAEITLYKNYGPNNEVYLAKGQAISFKVPANDQIATVQIGAKVPTGTVAEMKVNSTNVPIAGSATEMYYNLGVTNGTVTITNNSEGILSLTNLKITFTAKQNSTVTLAALSDEEQANAVAAVRALFAAPEPDPEPETFEPQRFDVSWNRSTVKVGQKATLTVKTSEDVAAITVDGVTVDTYRTRTQRTGWGWNAKKVTYREFTYTVTAAEAGTLDVSVAAVNAEGVSSAAVTATVTVQAASQRPGIGGWLDNIFGRWF